MSDLAGYQFVIPGACPPKGSKTRGAGRSMRESSSRVKPWTEAAVRSMRDPLGNPLARFLGPVYVAPLFVYKRPKTNTTPFPTGKTTIGDLDKLIRCLLDALTEAGVIVDDSLVVALPGPPRKVWGEQSFTIARVGPALPRFCPARMPGGDWQDCVCGSPAACGEASVYHSDRVVNPYA